MNRFKGFIGYTNEEFKELWKDALIVVDTNILINFYRFSSKDSSKTLLEILKNLKREQRLWVPHHVVLEYFYNFEKESDKPTEGYKVLRDKIYTLKDQAQKSYSSTESDYPYITTEKFSFFIDELEVSCDKFNEKVEKEIAELPDSNDLKEEVLELITDIVGQPYTQQEIDMIEKEGSERYDIKTPPGWKDRENKRKDIYRVHGSLKYNQKYGDLIVWNQIIDKANKDSIPIIFLTEEKKEDWWELDGRSIIKPQPNLLHEFYEKTGQAFYMYRSDNFIEKVNSHLKGSLSSEEIDTFTKDIQSIRDNENKNEKKYYKRFIQEKNIQEQLNKVNVNKLLKYCSKNEKEELKRSINNTFIKNDLTFSNDNYGKVISNAIERLTPRLINSALDLISQISQKDFGQGNELRKQLYEMPEDTVSKGLALIEFNERLENKIYFDDLPF